MSETIFECFKVPRGGKREVQAPTGYFFVCSAPAGFDDEGVIVLVTWRKAINRFDPGPAVPATASPKYRRRKKAAKR